MKFRKKPVVIEAVQWTGGNLLDVHEHFGTFRDWHLNEKSGTIIISTL
jgi:hypothetical protein